MFKFAMNFSYDFIVNHKETAEKVHAGEKARGDRLCLRITF